MKITDLQTRQTYFISCQDKLIRKYLGQLKIDWDNFWEKLTITNLKLLFLKTLADFEAGKISVDQFTGVTDRIYYHGKIWGPLEINEIDSKLDTALQWASELAYYHWQKDKNLESQKVYERILKNLEDYYEDNRQK